MSLISSFLGKILGYSFNITKDYMSALILFTFITKVILIPINDKVQINGIKLVKLTPELNMIKCDYYGDKDKINEETLSLYKRENITRLSV